jgi:hypothetical protein
MAMSSLLGVWIDDCAKVDAAVRSQAGSVETCGGTVAFRGLDDAARAGSQPGDAAIADPRRPRVSRLVP